MLRDRMVGYEQRVRAKPIDRTAFPTRLTPSGACLCPVAVGLLNQTEDSKVEIDHCLKLLSVQSALLEAYLPNRQFAAVLHSLERKRGLDRSDTRQHAQSGAYELPIFLKAARDHAEQEVCVTRDVVAPDDF